MPWFSRCRPRYSRKIRKIPGIAQGDVEPLQKLIDDKVAPYVDFERMTRLSVGRGWRPATESSGRSLSGDFRYLLVRTYSGALSRVTDTRSRCVRFKAQPADTDVGGSHPGRPIRRKMPIQLDLSPRKRPTPVGKIYDVKHPGVSLVGKLRETSLSARSTKMRVDPDQGAGRSQQGALPRPPARADRWDLLSIV